MSSFKFTPYEVKAEDLVQERANGILSTPLAEKLTIDVLSLTPITWLKTDKPYSVEDEILRAIRLIAARPIYTKPVRFRHFTWKEGKLAKILNNDNAAGPKEIDTETASVAEAIQWLAEFNDKDVIGILFVNDPSDIATSDVNSAVEAVAESIKPRKVNKNEAFKRLANKILFIVSPSFPESTISEPATDTERKERIEHITNIINQSKAKQRGDEEHGHRDLTPDLDALADATQGFSISRLESGIAKSLITHKTLDIDIISSEIEHVIQT